MGELHHLLERSSEYSVTAIVSPNGTLNYIADNALLYQETYDEVIVMAGTNDINDQGYVVTKRVLLVTDSHGRQLHHLLERSSDYSVTAIVSPNGIMSYILDNALLYQEKYDEVVVMAGTNDMNDKGVHDVHVIFKERIGNDLRRYNLPACRSDIAAVYTGEEPPRDVDLVVYPQGSDRRNQIKNLNSLAYPMVYSLLFPNGEYGYRTGVPHRQTNRTVTLRQFYSWRLAVRNGFSILHNGGKLFQQYIVDAWCKVEANQLWFIRQNQRSLRVENYRGLRRYLEERARALGARVGKLVVLPAMTVGSPRYMQARYREAMAIVARYGKPDLFITFTTNPNWPEIQENLEHHQRFEHRPDLVCRVFKSKFTKFLDDLSKGQVLSVTQTYTYVIEFQKRGLPHAHVLITMRPEGKITIDNVDDIVCAEFPNRDMDPTLYDIIVEHYVHRPCGANNPVAPCMRDGKCSKGYPMSFNDETIIDHVRRPVYRRRRDGRTAVVEENGNRQPKNCAIQPVLCKKIHVPHQFRSLRHTLSSMKYLYKYVHKGADCITIQASDTGEQTLDWDEIQNYLDCRYVSSTEAAYRLMTFPLADRSHSVMTLPVHLEK
ncbi:uncharacterized protein LOC124353255 [Homalodisca vitripennis]|uniref:uncharacterized protein LOC124353255 n=1 Tax=Homalodisca vitripennis TaxID=197043 RepID=UPI001EEC0C5C|nr:uncharacterized protein LOC124353255 [Homalodisca vitripennis]